MRERELNKQALWGFRTIHHQNHHFQEQGNTFCGYQRLFSPEAKLLDLTNLEKQRPCFAQFLPVFFFNSNLCFSPY